MGFRRAKSTQGNTNCQKNIFEDDQVPGHHPRALKKAFFKSDKVCSAASVRNFVAPLWIKYFHQPS